MPSDTGSASQEVERLAAFGRPDGPTPDEALRMFLHLRETSHERRAVATLLDTNARARLPDPLLLAVAAALVDRGEGNVATRVLAQSSSPAAMMMRADLAARAGDFETATGLVARVLAKDIDWPGARARHTLWSENLGRAGPIPRAREWETVVNVAPDAPFELARECGRGGAAVVYEALDRILGRRVAVKVYHRPDGDRGQLLHEARVASLLSGPGVVRIFDVDPDRGWLAMEWAQHGALAALIRSREGFLLPIDRWAVSLAGALARVHAAGWVHHDVKPANVLMRAELVPLLSDFGTARRIGEPSPPGSAGYLSPERIAQRPSDPRDDIYGYGRLLEDTLAALPSAAEGTRWRAIAAACTGEDRGRPRDGAELLAACTGDLRG